MTDDTGIKLPRRKFLIAAGGAVIAFAVGDIILRVGNSEQAAVVNSEKLVMVGQSGYHEQINDFLIKAFMQNNPDVKIEYIPKGYTDEYQSIVLSMRNHSSEYDVMYVDEPWVPLAMNEGWLAPIEGVNLSGYPKYLAEWSSRNGQVYAQPILGNSNFMFYRKDILDSIGLGRPKTWNDVLTAAKKIKSKYTDKGERIYGFSAEMTTGRRIANDAFPSFLYPFGGRYFAKDGGVKPVLNSQEAVEALKFMKGLLPYSHPQTTTWVNGFTDAILRGEIAMGIVWNGNIKDVDNPEKSKVVGKIDVMPYPTQKINFGAISGVWFYTVSKFSKNNRLADKFINYATSFEAQKSAAINVGLPPTRLPVYLDPEVKKKDRLAEEYYNILSVAKTVRTNPKWMSMWTPVGTYLYMGVTGEISPEDAIKQAYEEMLKVEVR